MKIDRQVPLDPALSAAADVMDHSKNPDDENYPFSVWINADRDDLGSTIRRHHSRSSILGLAGMPIDVARRLLDEVPDVPAGRAWKAAVADAIDATEADVVRPFDIATYDTDDEINAAEAFDDYVGHLATVSPLLAPIIDILEQQTMLMRADSIGDMVEWRERITEDGITVGRDGWCDKHEDNCYGEHTTLAQWTHIDAIAPGTRDSIIRHLARLDANLPPIGDNDNGAARKTPTT